jgi:hypothetical protein
MPEKHSVVVIPAPATEAEKSGQRIETPAESCKGSQLLAPM